MKTVLKFAFAAAVCVVAFSCSKENTGNDDPQSIKPFAPTSVQLSSVSQTIQLRAAGASADLKYVVGANTITHSAAVWDVEKNEVYDIAGAAEATFLAVNKSGVAVGEIQGGHAIMSAGSSATVLFHNVGEIINTEWGPVSTGDAGSSAYAVSEDGTIAGFYFDSAWNPNACIWTDSKTRVNLPLPSAESAGFDFDASEARWISSDGSVIAGWLRDDKDTNPLVIWTKNDKGTYDCNPVCATYYHPDGEGNKPYMQFSITAMSADGNWFGLQVAAPYDWENWELPVVQTARLNLKSGEMEVLPAEESLEIFSISNDGTAVGSGGDFLDRKGYVWMPGKKNIVAIESMVKGFAGLSRVSPCYIAPDNSGVAGFAVDADFNSVSFIIR